MKSILLFVVITSVLLFSCSDTFENSEFIKDETKLNFEDFVSIYFVEDEVPKSFLVADLSTMEGEIIDLYRNTTKNKEMVDVKNFILNIDVIQAFDKKADKSLVNFVKTGTIDTKLLTKYFIEDDRIFDEYIDFVRQALFHVYHHELYVFFFSELYNENYELSFYDGIIPDGYGSATDAQKAWAIRNPTSVGPLKKSVSRVNEDMAEIFGPGYQGTDNIKANAYRHAGWNFWFVYELRATGKRLDEARTIAKSFTDLHEATSDAPESYRKFDLHNNSVGLRYASMHPLQFRSWMKIKMISAYPIFRTSENSAINQIISAPSDELIFMEVINRPVQINGNYESFARVNIHDKYESQFFVDDFNNDGKDDIGYRRAINHIHLDYDLTNNQDGDNLKNNHNYKWHFGNGPKEDGYYAGDINGDGSGDILIRRGNKFLGDKNKDGIVDFTWSFGLGESEDQYLLGDMNGNNRVDILARRGNKFVGDFDRNGYVDFTFYFGNGNSESDYYLGDVNGDGKDDIILRRGNRFEADTDKNGFVDFIQVFGHGNSEDEYFLADWNNDGKDEVSIRRGNEFLADTNLDGYVDYKVRAGLPYGIYSDLFLDKVNER